MAVTDSYIMAGIEVMAVTENYTVEDIVVMAVTDSYIMAGIEVMAVTGAATVPPTTAPPDTTVL